MRHSMQWQGITDGLKILIQLIGRKQINQKLKSQIIALLLTNTHFNNTNDADKTLQFSFFI